MGLIDAISLLAPGATVAALGADTIDATGQGATTFVFAPVSGRDLARGFNSRVWTTKTGASGF